MKETLRYFVSLEFFESLIVIAMCGVILSFIKKYLIKKVAYRTYDTKGDQKKSTFIGVLFSILQYLSMLVAVFIILSINGINISGIFTGLGIVATIVGLALQDALKDILSGINIYNNNFYKVGDLIRYNGNLCEVKYFNARVTKLRNMFTNASYTICNSNISSAEKVKDGHTVSLEFKFSTSEDDLKRGFDKAAEKLREIEGMKKVLPGGITQFSERGIVWTVVYYMDPKQQFMLYFDIMGAIHSALLEEGLEPRTFTRVVTYPGNPEKVDA